MATRVEQREETRAQLLRAARAAFTEGGFEGTTIRAIARRAGVASGTVFVHFPDKHALLAAVFQEGLGAVLDDAWRTLPRRPLKKQLLHLAARLFAHYAEQPALARVIVKESLFMTGESGAALDAQRFAFLSKVAALLDEARARGEWTAPIEVADAARLFFSLYFSTLVAGLRGDLGAPDEWTRALERALAPWLWPRPVSPRRRKT